MCVDEICVAFIMTDPARWGWVFGVIGSGLISGFAVSWWRRLVPMGASRFFMRMRAG
jgi:hypothetical protein